jgi:hypothetical protein
VGALLESRWVVPEGGLAWRPGVLCMPLRERRQSEYSPGAPLSVPLIPVTPLLIVWWGGAPTEEVRGLFGASIPGLSASLYTKAGNRK